MDGGWPCDHLMWQIGAAPGYRKMTRNIAIVEDEAAIRHNYADAFRRQGYTVSGYEDRSQGAGGLCRSPAGSGADRRVAGRRTRGRLRSVPRVATTLRHRADHLPHRKGHRPGCGIGSASGRRRLSDQRHQSRPSAGPGCSAVPTSRRAQGAGVNRPDDRARCAASGQRSSARQLGGSGRGPCP